MEEKLLFIYQMSIIVIRCKCRADCLSQTQYIWHIQIENNKYWILFGFIVLSSDGISILGYPVTLKTLQRFYHENGKLKINFSFSNWPFWNTEIIHTYLF